MPYLSRLFKHYNTVGMLAWPAWLRVLAVLPALALLWCSVAWALQDVPLL